MVFTPGDYFFIADCEQAINTFKHLVNKKNETEKFLQFAQKDPLSYPLYVDTMYIFAEQEINRGL